MPMHCSANVGPPAMPRCSSGCPAPARRRLSADPKRTLLGDDEHGWSRRGIFNFEGGCYAKTIRLSKEAEPEIWDASIRFGTVLENVILDPATRVPDFDDDRLTENTRSAYPLEFISNASRSGHRQPSQERRHADRRRLRHPAADRHACRRARRCITSCPATPQRWPAPRRAWQRAAGHLLDLLRRAVHAAPSQRLRQYAARADRQAQGRLLAGQHRLDGRQVRHRPAHADQGHARAGGRGPVGRLEVAARCAPIRCSVSRCRRRCRASTRPSSIRATPGATRQPTTRRLVR